MYPYDHILNSSQLVNAFLIASFVACNLMLSTVIGIMSYAYNCESIV
jgi:hypothetical protein